MDDNDGMTDDNADGVMDDDEMASNNEAPGFGVAVARGALLVAGLFVRRQQ